MWAPSTWRGRASVLSQYCRAHKTDPTDITPEKVVAFIMAKLHSRQISLQTAHTYLASLRALQRTFTADPMSLLSRALIRKGALIPEAQALPLSKPLLYQWLDRLPIQLMVPVFLAWKTASRWDDMVHLQRRDVKILNEKELVISFGAKTKTTRANPFRPDTTVLVAHETAMTQVVAYLDRLPESALLTSLTTATFERLIRTLEVPPEWKRRFPGTLSHFTAHSLKRGAVHHLASEAGEGRLDPRLIPLLARHKDPLHGYPEMTFRYAADAVPLARALGSQRATLLL